MYTVTKYEPKDYESLDHMSKEEVINLLEALEGNWLPRRPSVYAKHKELDELEYSLLKYCKAVELACKWLRNEERKEEKPIRKGLVKELHHYAKMYRSDQTLGRALEHTEEILDEAASAIELLLKERENPTK